MNKLDQFQKYSLFGGARRATIKKVDKTSIYLKKINSLTHNIGLVSMSISTSASNLYSAYADIESCQQDKGQAYRGSNNFYSNNNNKKNFNNSIKANIRYGAFATRNSISFGLPYA